MKAALIGLSHPHSGILLATLERRPEITSISVWDTAGSFVPPKASKVGQVTADLDGLLSDPELSFALVCVSTDASAALCRRVLEAGKHLLSEKPVGFTADEILNLQRIADRSHLVASVLYTRRFHPCVLRARVLMRSGELGSLLSVENRFLTTQVRFRHPQSWLFQRKRSGGGVLLWLGCHCLDLIHHIAGDEIVSVGARYAAPSGEPIDVEEIAALALQFRSGAVGTFHAGYTLAYSGEGYLNGGGYDSYLGFNSARGRVVWPDLTPRLQVESPPAAGQSAHREEQLPFADSPAYGGAAGEAFFSHYFAALRGQGSPPTTLEDAARVARVIAAAEESSRSGRFIATGAPLA